MLCIASSKVIYIYLSSLLNHLSTFVDAQTSCPQDRTYSHGCGTATRADYCCSLIAYGDKMVNDLFDGTKGFAIDGGIKDAL